MKAAETTDAVIAAIKSGKYSFIRANFPAGDMVGHTGNMQAATIAVASVDLCLGRLMAAADEFGATLVITADHGNADEMFEETKKGKQPKTAHTLNPVPFIIYDNAQKFTLKDGHDGQYGLANVAATVAAMLGVAAHGAWEESMI